MKFNLAEPNNPLIMVKGLINGEGPFNFILDTGASSTVIEKHTAEKLGLLSNSVATQARGASGDPIDTYLTKIESIKVDNASVKCIQVAIIDLSNLSKFCFNEELAGIIGYNFLKNYRVTIDYPKCEIFFEV